MSRSCYVLELSVVPGDIRRADAFVYSRAEHVRACLEWEFQSPSPDHRGYAASLAVWAGETIALWVVQSGRFTQVIDLRPLLSVRLPGRPPLRLDDAAALDALQGDDALAEAVFADGSGVRFAIDWDALGRAAPALEGDLLRPGQEIDLDPPEDELIAALAQPDTHLDCGDTLAYGYNDLEGSRTARDLPGFRDPDPKPKKPRHTSRS